MDTTPSPEPARLRSGRHALSKEDVERSQCERILDAIIELVAAKGYPSTTVSDVIAAAGVSRATFYQQFRDKEDCFLVAHDAILEAVVGCVLPAFATDGPWTRQVREGLGALLELLAREPAIARVGVIEVLGGGEAARNRYSSSIEVLSAFLALGGAGVDLPQDVRDAIPLVALGGITSAISDEVALGREEQLGALLPDLLYMAFSPYLGHEQALRESRIPVA
jgi:AcrR family transcriptional regulator